jgi:hypothetical protein
VITHKAMLDPIPTCLAEVFSDVTHSARRCIQGSIAPLCRLLVQRRRPETVLEIVDEAQKIGRSTDELLFEAELSRLKARALLMYGSPEARLTARPKSRHSRLRAAKTRGQSNFSSRETSRTSWASKALATRLANCSLRSTAGSPKGLIRSI